ncbi:MAG TPA: hypothetical protein VIV11_39050 [Kofleriaceae bacterium]
MRSVALAAVTLTALVASASADDTWMGWQTLTDGQANGVDVSFRPSSARVCGRPKPVVAMFPRIRSRYAERVAGRLEVVYDDATGKRTGTVEIDLAPNETKLVETASICHDTSRPLQLAIVGLRFPDRDAEQKRLAEAKAAADKAAAEKAAAQKAAAQKSAAEQAAAEATRRKEIDARQRQLDETARKQDEVNRAEHERERARVAALEEEKAAALRRAEAQKATRDDLRRGEVSVQLPTGYQQVDYGSDLDSGLTLGVRLELRLFAWWAVSGERGRPLGTGVEFALAGGYAKVSNSLQSQSSPADTSFTTGFARARVWLGSLAVGVAGEWTRFAYSPGGGAPTERHSLYAIGPEAALGFAANRLLAVEVGARVGAVAAGSDSFSFGATSDLCVAAYGLVVMNYLYGGATATRYVLSSGGVPETWNAMGVLGVRVPF